MKNNPNSIVEVNPYVNTYKNIQGELSDTIQLTLSGTTLSGTISALVDDDSFVTTRVFSMRVQDDLGNTKQALVHVFGNPNRDLVQNLNLRLDVNVSIDVSDWDLQQREAQLFNCNDDGTDLDVLMVRFADILRGSPGYQNYPYEVLEEMLKMDEAEFRRRRLFQNTYKPAIDPEDPKQHGGVILMF